MNQTEHINIEDIKELKPFLLTKNEEKRWSKKEWKFFSKLLRYMRIAYDGFSFQNENISKKVWDIIEKVHSPFSTLVQFKLKLQNYRKWSGEYLYPILWSDKHEISKVIEMFDELVGRRLTYLIRTADSINYTVLLTHRELARENEKKKILLLSASYKNPDSLLSRESLPFDVLKIILYFSGIHISIWKYWSERLDDENIKKRFRDGSIFGLLEEIQ